jgi:two-component system, OmpR family, response regulator BaeR
MVPEILVVEDEIKITRLMEDYLLQAGFRVICMENGEPVVPYVQKTPPSLVLLDILLPGKDGLEICREVRAFSQIPIIMITARCEEIDRLLGLELGADDYICKPFSPREMVARVKAVLKRTGQPSVEKNFEVNRIRMSIETHQVFIENHELKLTPCEFNLLKTFLGRPGRIFSRNELIGVVQGYDFEGYDRTIDSHVKNLRKKIAAFLPGTEIIKTIYGMGYKLISGEDL